MQIKAAFTAVACQHRGRNLAGFICYFCWGEVVVARPTPCSVQLSLNPRIVLLSTTFPSLAKNQRRQMYSTWSEAFLWKCLLSFGRRQGFVSHINLIHTIVSFCQMTFQCTRSNQFSSVFFPPSRLNKLWSAGKKCQNQDFSSFFFKIAQKHFACLCTLFSSHGQQFSQLCPLLFVVCHWSRREGGYIFDQK